MQETRVQSFDQEDPWRWKWQASTVFLPGEFQRQSSPVYKSHKESDTTKQLTHTHTHTHTHTQSIMLPNIYIEKS